MHRGTVWILDTSYLTSPVAFHFMRAAAKNSQFHWNKYSAVARHMWRNNVIWMNFPEQIDSSQIKGITGLVHALKIQMHRNWISVVVSISTTNLSSVWISEGERWMLRFQFIQCRRWWIIVFYVWRKSFLCHVLFCLSFDQNVFFFTSSFAA